MKINSPKNSSFEVNYQIFVFSFLIESNFLQWREELKPKFWLFEKYSHRENSPVDYTLFVIFRNSFIEKRLAKCPPSEKIQDLSDKRKRLLSYKSCSECEYDNDLSSRKCTHCSAPLVRMHFEMPGATNEENLSII